MYWSVTIKLLNSFEKSLPFSNILLKAMLDADKDCQSLLNIIGVCYIIYINYNILTHISLSVWTFHLWWSAIFENFFTIKLLLWNLYLLKTRKGKLHVSHGIKIKHHIKSHLRLYLVLTVSIWRWRWRHIKHAPLKMEWVRYKSLVFFHRLLTALDCV